MAKGYYLIVVPNSDFEYSQVYDLGIKPVMQDEGLPFRFTAVHSASVPEIMSQIDQAAQIIIVLDKREPDVFYIAGVCHSRALRTILICESSDDVPILLRAHRKIIYGPDASSRNLKGFRLELQLALADAGADRYQPDTPVEVYFPDDRKRPMFEREHLARLRQLEEENREMKRQLEVIPALQRKLEREAFVFPVTEKASEGTEKGPPITFKPIHDSSRQGSES